MVDHFKNGISSDILNSLTMEDFWKSPRLKKHIHVLFELNQFRIINKLRFQKQGKSSGRLKR